jgi:hypothetical protein
MTYRADNAAGAHCADHDPELWHHDEDNSPTTQAAKAICGMCPAQRACLQLGIDGDEWGVWGGMTRRERHALVRYVAETIPADESHSPQAKWVA